MDTDRDDGPGYEQQDLLDQEQAYIRHECARVAAMVCQCGQHPERTKDVEIALLQTAGLERFELAA